MIAISPRRFLGLLLILGLAFAAANVAVSQVPTLSVKGKLTKSREFVLIIGAGQTVQMSDVSWTDGLVPSNRTFVITDVVINNIGNTTAFNMKVIRDSDAANAPAFTVPAESTFAHSFATGLEYPGGSRIDLRNGGAQTATFIVTGYERK